MGLEIFFAMLDFGDGVVFLCAQSTDVQGGRGQWELGSGQWGKLGIGPALVLWGDKAGGLREQEREFGFLGWIPGVWGYSGAISAPEAAMQRPTRRTKVRSIRTMPTATPFVLGVVLCAVASPRVLAGVSRPAKVVVVTPDAATDSGSADLDCHSDEDLLAISFETLSCIKQTAGGGFDVPTSGRRALADLRIVFRVCHGTLVVRSGADRSRGELHA